MFKNKSVYFLDVYHGFWRLGTCYKEEKKFYMCRDSVGSRYKVPKMDEMTTIELFEDKKQQATNEQDTR